MFLETKEKFRKAMKKNIVGSGIFLEIACITGALWARRGGAFFSHLARNAAFASFSLHKAPVMQATWKQNKQTNKKNKKAGM